MKRWLDILDRLIGWCTEVPATLLVLLEVGILFVGVVFRYALDKPLVWTGALSSLLFMWLSMLGAVIAVRRHEHMRLETVTGRLGERWRVRWDVLGRALMIVFCLAVLKPAYAYYAMQSFITIPALGISDSYRVAALPVGLVLMIVLMLIQMVRRGALRDTVMAVVAIAVVCAALYLARPLLASIGNLNLIVFFVIGVGACVLIGIPIAFAFGLGTLAYLVFTTQVPLSVLVGRMGAGMSHTVLIAVPLFVFLGVLMEITGIAEALVKFLLSLVGHLRAGLSYVLIGAMYAVSGISGAKAADMAAVAPVLLPAVRERNENTGEFVALMSASGAMGETIPPSLVLIIIGSVTGVSISALFTGGLLPAAVGALALIILCSWRARRSQVHTTARASGRARLQALFVAIPALALPLVIRAAVVEGVATATEVATVGIVYSLLVGVLVYRKFNLRRFYPGLIETASLSGAILLIIGLATAMSWALTQSGFSQDLAATLGHMPGHKIGFFAISIVVFALLGSVLEGIPAIVLFGPLLFPIAGNLGINEVHYAMVAILAMGLGLFAPPFGVGFYAACVIGHADPDEAMRRIWPYLGALLVAVIVVAAIPWISTAFLPHR